MPYSATRKLSDLDATKPAGSEAPSVLDDAIREAKLVIKTVLNNFLNDVGTRKEAVWKYMSNIVVATGAINQWNRLPLTTFSDPTSILAAGTYTNSVKPPAGFYLVEFSVHGISCGTFQGRVSEATGNTLAPSASNALSDLVGSIENSSNAATYAYARSVGMGVLQADGIKSYGFDFLNSAVGNIGQAAGFGGLSGPIAIVKFSLLGTLVS